MRTAPRTVNLKLVRIVVQNLTERLRHIICCQQNGPFSDVHVLQASHLSDCFVHMSHVSVQADIKATHQNGCVRAY